MAFGSEVSKLYKKPTETHHNWRKASWWKNVATGEDSSSPLFSHGYTAAYLMYFIIFDKKIHEICIQNLQYVFNPRVLEKKNILDLTNFP